jgi:NAD(P)-dependent dehydrogenase (short-subunit alcohol dehydrogenase family)
MLDFDLAGKVALVTGARGGIGCALVVRLAQHGARCVLSGRNVDELHSLAAAVGGAVVPADLRVAQMTDLFNEAEAAFGEPVRIVVNNAGIGQGGSALKLKRETWDDVLHLDLSVPFFIAQEAARRMIEKGIGGSIINISSIFGERPQKNMAAYAVAKAGLIQLTRCLALEWGDDGIRVNALAPGWHRTEMVNSYLDSERGKAVLRDVPMGEFGSSPDLGGALILLASEAGRYITGSVVTVDGGLSAGMPTGGFPAAKIGA